MRLAISKVPLVTVGADTASIIYFTSDQEASRKFINVCKSPQLQLSLYRDGKEIKPRHILGPTAPQVTLCIQTNQISSAFH